MQQLLKGHAVKLQKGVNFNQRYYHSLNKMILKCCVLYHVKCGKNRNEACCDTEVQRRRAVNQKETIEKYSKQNRPMQVKLLARRLKVDVDKCKIETILEWIQNAKKIIKRVKEMLKK